jgi:hypothetical protein
VHEKVALIAAAAAELPADNLETGVGAITNEDRATDGAQNELAVGASVDRHQVAHVSHNHFAVPQFVKSKRIPANVARAPPDFAIGLLSLNHVFAWNVFLRRQWPRGL